MGTDSGELSSQVKDKLYGLTQAVSLYRERVEAQGGLLLVLPDNTGIPNVELIDMVVKTTSFKMLEAMKYGEWIIIYAVG